MGCALSPGQAPRSPGTRKRKHPLKQIISSILPFDCYSVHVGPESQADEAFVDQLLGRDLPALAMNKIRVSDFELGPNEPTTIEPSEQMQFRARFLGDMLFPPEAEWPELSARQHEKSSLPVIYSESSHAEPFLISMEIWCVVLVHVSEQSLDVQCKRLFVSSEVDAGGDPVTESWLPKEEVLRCLQMVIDRRLDAAVGGEFNN